MSKHVKSFAGDTIHQYSCGTVVCDAPKTACEAKAFGLVWVGEWSDGCNMHGNIWCCQSSFAAVRAEYRSDNHEGDPVAELEAMRAAGGMLIRD
jgi:hypothetical protein